MGEKEDGCLRSIGCEIAVVPGPVACFAMPFVTPPVCGNLGLGILKGKVEGLTMVLGWFDLSGSACW